MMEYYFMSERLILHNVTEYENGTNSTLRH